jgi:hypothetical protein
MVQLMAEHLTCSAITQCEANWNILILAWHTFNIMLS